MVRRFSHHDFPMGQLIQIFYNILSTLNQTIINVTCGGMIRKKSPSKAYVIIEDMASNTNQFSSSNRHIESLMQLVPSSPLTCEQYGNTGHKGKGCQMGNFFTKVGRSIPTSLGEDNTHAKLRTFIDLYPCNIRTKDKSKKKGGQAYMTQ
ncbi:hypothetical protein CR513_18065, partial [Mucuna pruriens]